MRGLNYFFWLKHYFRGWLYALTDCLGHVVLYEISETSLLFTFCVFFVVISMQSFYKENPIDFQMRTKWCFTALQITYHKCSTLNTVAQNCLWSFGFCLFFVILSSRDLVSLMTGPIGFLNCCILIKLFLWNQILCLLWHLKKNCFSNVWKKIAFLSFVIFWNCFFGRFWA